MADKPTRSARGSSRAATPVGPGRPRAETRRAPEDPSVPTARQRAFLEVELRAQQQGVKFSTTYRSCWDGICRDFGGETSVRDALAELRGGGAFERRPVHAALEELARLPLLMGRGPVVPRDLDDSAPESRWPKATAPRLSYLLGVREIDGGGGDDLSTGRGFEFPVLAILDLSRPTTQLAQGIAALRREIGIKARRNPSRGSKWEGSNGWKRTFELLHRAETSGLSLRALGRFLNERRLGGSSTDVRDLGPASHLLDEIAAAKNASKRILRALAVIDGIDAEIRLWGPIWAPRFFSQYAPSEDDRQGMTRNWIADREVDLEEAKPGRRSGIRRVRRKK